MKPVLRMKLILLLILFLVCQSGWSQLNESQSKAALLDSMFAKLHQEGNFNGNVLVAQKRSLKKLLEE